MAENNKKEETSEGIDISGNKIVWIIGALVLLVAGYFGLRAIFASMENFRLTLVDAPKEAVANTTATFTWRIDGPATTINHTSIHFGTTSQPGELTSDVKPENTPYKLLIQDFANGNYNIPLQFVGNIVFDTPGAYYYRVHATIKGKEYWSDEYSMEVKVPDYKVTILSAPSQAVEDAVFSFTWRVDGVPTTINHTSIHYGTESNPGVLGKDVKPEDTKYSDLVKDFAKGSYNIPLQFVGNSTITKPETYYYRGHAIINNENYWTDESTLTVTSAKEVSVSPTKASAVSPLPTEEEEEITPTSTL